MRGARLLLAATIVVLVVACGRDTDDRSGDDAAGGTGTASPHPPADVDELAEVFDPLLEPYGLRLTRGALIDRTDGGYEVSDTGNHLALYAEPIDEEAYPAERYIENFWPTTAELTPLVFERWSALDSYDLCQEPPASLDPSPEPFPHTQVDITRERAAEIDWRTGDLVDLLAASREGDGVRVIVARQLYPTPEYQEADEAAGRGDRAPVTTG